MTSRKLLGRLGAPMAAAALLLLNQGDGTFAEDLDFTVLDVRADNSAWGDYADDGDLDGGSLFR